MGTGRLGELRGAMEAYSGGFDPALITVADATAVVDDAAAIEKMAATLKALAAARAAESGGWRRRGARSPAHDLAHQTGTSVGAAADALEAAQALGSLPVLAGAAKRGAVSAQQLVAIADAAAADPRAESRLVEAARHSSLAELRDECARTKAAARPRQCDAEHAEVHRSRFLRTFRDRHGGWNLSVRNVPEVGAEVMAVLRPFHDRVFRRARAEGRRESFEAYGADALVDLVRQAASAHRAMSVGRDDKGPDLVAAGAARAEGRPAGPAGPFDPVADGAIAPGGSAGPVDPCAGPADPTGTGPSGGSEPAPAASTEPADPTGAGPSGVSEPAEGAAATSAQPADPGAAGTSDVVEATAAAPEEVLELFTLGTGGEGIDPAGGDAARRARPSPDGGGGPPRVPTKMIVRIDFDALMRGCPIDGEVCEISGIGPVPVSVVRAMLATGNPFLAAVVTRGVDVVSVAHLGRRATAHQVSALEWRDPECPALGCNNKAHLQIDHREDWATTKITLLGLLDRPCTHHHDLKTRLGWAFVEGAGKRPMVAPDDPRHPKFRQRARPATAPSVETANDVRAAAGPTPKPPGPPGSNVPDVGPSKAA